MTKRVVGILGGVLPHCTLKRTAVAIALAVLTSTPAVSQGHSQPGKQFAIDFAGIVDTTEGFSSFGSFPAINNHGDVVFTAFRSGVGSGVFRGREAGEKVATIASTLDGLSAFGDDVAVNPGGVVAFGATTTTGSRAIFKGDGASRTLIADSTANGLVKVFLGSPSINAAGRVAFSAVLTQHGSPAGIFTGNGGPLTTVASTSTTGFASFANAGINDFGTVVFAANLSDGTHGVFTASNVLTDIVDTKTHSQIDSFQDAVINNAGTIADVAALLPFDALEIFTGTARGITPRNDPANPPFAALEHPSINNRDAVAVAAILPFAGANVPTGIFLEVSGGQSLIPIIKPGDKLFGSTVDHVDLGRFALNDRFQMAFSYTLTNGRSGIAVASFDGEKSGY